MQPHQCRAEDPVAVAEWVQAEDRITELAVEAQWTRGCWATAVRGIGQGGEYGCVHRHTCAKDVQLYQAAMRLAPAKNPRLVGLQAVMTKGRLNALGRGERFRGRRTWQ